MRIAQVTSNSYSNYGNVLQKYALNRTLKKFADWVEVLWLNEKFFWVETGAAPNPPKYIRETYPLDFQRWYFYEAVRLAKIKDFDSRYITTRFNIPYVEEIGDDYDFFIIGSDQVWNPHWCIGFLEFAPKEKRISYAPSIAAPEIPDKDKNYFRNGISSFNHVSVRESTSVRLVEELTGKKPELVLDPVMMLTADEWRDISKPPVWFNHARKQKYILSYCLRAFPPPALKIFADKFNLSIINLLDITSYNHYTIDPAEFVWLIDNAALVYTNSFHATVFSILFRKPFVCYEYLEKPDERLAERRMPDLLQMFGLSNRQVTPKENYSLKSPLEIDFSKRDKVLPKERAKSFKFLANALGVDVPQKTSRGGGR